MRTRPKCVIHRVHFEEPEVSSMYVSCCNVQQNPNIMFYGTDTVDYLFSPIKQLFLIIHVVSVLLFKQNPEAKLDLCLSSPIKINLLPT